MQSARKYNKFGTISRDEMNLAEFPLTVLSTRVNPKLKTLEFTDTIHAKDGKPIHRKWIITAADKFGLPTSSDDEVLLGLLKLTVDSGLNERKIYFTRYELLKALRWSTEGRSYSRLSNALDRLSGVRIKATNAFYDNESKAHSTRNFGIIDAYEINDGRDTRPKPSFFIWSEVLFKSFQAGFIKKLDLNFFLTLQSAVSKRLYRYLDKHFWYKSCVRINLFLLAHEKIGVSRNYRYPSSLKQQLDPAIEELVASGFLEKHEYRGRGKDSEVVFYAARGKPRVVDRAGQAAPRAPEQLCEGSDKRTQDGRTQDGVTASGVVDQLIERHIAELQANRLVMGKSEDELTRMRKIIDHYDQLVASQSHLISRNPAGFLYRAVENPDRYVLPGESRQTIIDFEDGRRTKSSGGSAPNSSHKEDTDQARRALRKLKQRDLQHGSSTADLEGRYLVERKHMINKLRAEAEPQLIERVTREVEQALAKVRVHISDEGFKRAITHGVDEKLAKLFALPDFDEWQRGFLRKSG